MNGQDPYKRCKVEISDSLTHAQHLFARYREVTKSDCGTIYEKEWLISELRNALRSIDWDLQDLHETCTLLLLDERKQSAIGLTHHQLQKRFDFISNTTVTVTSIRECMSVSDKRFNNANTMFGPSTSSDKGAYKYSKLDDDDGGGGGSSYVDQTLQQQQMILDRQDDGLERIGDSVHVLKGMSARIGDELDEQGIMLDDLGRDMDRTESKMDHVLKKLAKVTHMSDDNRQCTAILLLGGILAVLVILFIIL